jgi:hypothetical protein
LCLLLKTFEKNSEDEYFPGLIKKLMGPFESAPQELSNEWSCQYVPIILNVLDNFCVSLLVTEVAISH